MTKIKICGIFRDEDCAYINEAMPDYFGMIIHFEKSHRSVSPSRAAEIRGQIRREIPAVGVFVNEELDVIKELLRSGAIDIAQLHGQETPEEILRIREDTGKPVWKAFKIRSRADVEQAFSSPADLILLDNGYGTGEAFDWSLIGTPKRPFALAGGLTCENMETAINALSPHLIDISSGVETEKKKDKTKIMRAVSIAHGVERS